MTQAASNAVSETDTTARGPLVLLLASALGWLVVSGLLAIIGTIQLQAPAFLSACSWLTYGHTQALQETVFVYGWAANAAFATAVWLLGKLGGASLRGLGLMKVGIAFWNLGLTIGLVAIILGDASAVPFLQMPAYVHPLLLVAYAAIATPGILAWTGRRQQATFATQWYAVAALFLFPWLYSVAQVMLLATPVRGVAQAAVEAWFAQNILTLWLVPTALAAAYYLVPKLTGRILSNYDFAPHGFWALLFFGAWTGTRHLLGGPLPAWVPTLGIVATLIVLFHYLIIALNLRAGLSLGKGDASLGFVAVGLIAYLLGGVLDAVFSFGTFAEKVQFTYFPVAQLKLALAGSYSFIVFGAIYYFAPRVTGIAWPSPGLIRAHFRLMLLGLVVTVVSLAAAGWSQGQGLLDPKMSFDAIAAATHPWLLAAIVGEGLTLLGTLVVLVHFIRLQVLAGCAGFCCSPVALEASAS
ncbi:MAG TPA: cbb3-type cytochrome c oxidase subunit I [Opitutaceae bacterium]|nr:cbb3-type cytochrome c oxidase subunit I [Opitutaceae bacterium]